MPPIDKVNMSKNPLLSIITVSAFDEERLSKTMNSLLRIPKNIEHIAVIPENDLSSLVVWKKIRKISNAKFKVIHDKNYGVYEAMNLGVHEATGDYICFWNAGDELISRSALTVLTATLQTVLPTWLICQGDFSWHEPQILKNSELQGFVLNEPHKFISHQTVISKKEFFIDLGGFDTRFKVVADTAMITLMIGVKFPYFEKNKVVKVETPKFASINQRRARAEIFLIALLYLKRKQRIKAIYNIFLREVLNISKKSLKNRF